MAHTPPKSNVKPHTPRPELWEMPKVPPPPARAAAEILNAPPGRESLPLLDRIKRRAEREWRGVFGVAFRLIWWCVVALCVLWWWGAK
jgi:hypothetical protein